MRQRILREGRGLQGLQHRLDPPVAGAIGGLVAGVAYLAAQVGTAAVLPGTEALAPLHRLAAMLLGEGAVSTDVHTARGSWGIALLIHFTLAALFGRLVERAARGRRMAVAVPTGMLVGLALYAVNFHVIAPSAFPWFDQAPALTTATNHLLFGGVAAAVSHLLSRNGSDPG